MTFPTTDLLMTFSVYSFFVFYLQKWTTIFRGASLAFETFLNFFMGIATIYGLGILVYYGYKVHWTAPITLFAMSFILKGLMIWVEATLANWIEVTLTTAEISITIGPADTSVGRL